MWQKLTLLLVFLFSFLITACANLPISTAGAALSPTPGTTTQILLELAPNQAQPSQVQLDAANAVLSERFAAFGLSGVQVSETTANGQPAFQIIVPHFSGDASQTLGQLWATDRLEFWSTGSTPVQVGTTLDPMQYVQYNPGGNALFTNSDLDTSKVSLGQDQTGRSQINFAMNSSASERFSAFTQQNIGQYLTITLDKVVLISAVIQSAINGPGVIQGSFTPQQAKAIVSSLQYPPLPVILREASQQTYTR